MSARSWSVMLLAWILGLSGGCQSSPPTADPLGQTTSARIADVHLSGLALESATLNFQVEITNPHPVPLPLKSLDYVLASGGEKFLDGQAGLQGAIPPRTTRSITIPATVNFFRTIEALGNVARGSIMPFDADLRLAVEAPNVGLISLPMQVRGKLPVPSSLAIELTAIQWQTLTPENARAVLRLKIGNRNQFPLNVSRIRLDLALADTPIVVTDVDKPVSFAAGEERDLETPIAFSTASLDKETMQVLRTAEAEYHLTGVVRCTTPFGPIDFPYERTGQTKFTK